MLIEAVINLVDIHDRLVMSLVYCAISHWYYTSSSCGLSILPCLFTGNIRPYFIKKIQTWNKFRVVTAPVLKFRVVSRPPCPRLAARLHHTCRGTLQKETTTERLDFSKGHLERYRSEKTMAVNSSRTRAAKVTAQK